MATDGGSSAAERAAALWSGLDVAFEEAFRQAWDALRTGNVPVGACVATADGSIVHSARNRIRDSEGPTGEVWGSAVAHAEINALARVPYGCHQGLVLTTTLEPCLQCAAAIRLAPVTRIRFAGADRYWEGCHDFTRLSAREARRAQPVREGPRRDRIGAFATLISRLGPPLPAYDAWLRETGEGASVDLAEELRTGGVLDRVLTLEVGDGFVELWPYLDRLGIGESDQIFP